MDKIGLCVRYTCNNYGSMLQIFATQKMIEDLGHRYEIIRYDKHALSSLLRQVPSLWNPAFMEDQRRISNNKEGFQDYPDIKSKVDERRQLFAEYRKKYIGPYSPIYKGYTNLNKASVNYDAIIVGSDQLWNPAGLESGFYNLMFVDQSVKKISLATSFGVSSIDKRQMKKTAEFLNRLDHISVREESGQKIVKDLTGRDSIIALDPTLMYDREKWLSFFDNDAIMDKPYIFAYFLGLNDMHRKSVVDLSKRTRLPIVCCPHLDHFNPCDIEFGDVQRFNTDPVDFLNLIRNAEFVCTDSFHGSVFSIINHKKFMTFNRFSGENKHSTNTRIDNLLGKTKLTERRWIPGEADIFRRINNEIDYNLVDSIISDWRESSWSFLNEALL